jgi:hypothetical protein
MLIFCLELFVYDKKLIYFLSWDEHTFKLTSKLEKFTFVALETDAFIKLSDTYPHVIVLLVIDLDHPLKILKPGQQDSLNLIDMLNISKLVQPIFDFSHSDFWGIPIKYFIDVISCFFTSNLCQL